MKLGRAPLAAVPLAWVFPGVGTGVGAAAYAAAAVLIVVAVLLFVLALRGVGAILERDDKVTRFRFGPIRDSEPAATAKETRPRPEQDSNLRPIP